MTDSTRPSRPTLRSAAPDQTRSVAPTRPTWITRLFRGTRPTESSPVESPSVDNATATDRKSTHLVPVSPTRPTKEIATRPTTPTPVPTRPTPANRTRPVVVNATVVDPDTIAPIPTGLKWLGVWADRTVGAMPILAPLIVSGFLTMDVFSDALASFTSYDATVIAAVSFLVAWALEGGLWKLVRLYERHLVAGDSTIGIRAGIALYIAVISGLIFWHAHYQAGRADSDLGMSWLPAAGVAIMCALGVYISSRVARWQRRRELHAAGRIDRQAPKFSALAWILCPIETPKALRHAVKWRIDSPIDAVTDLRLYKAAKKPPLWVPLEWKPADEPTDRTDVPTAVDSTAANTRPVDRIRTDRPTDVARLTQPTAVESTRPRSVRPTSTDTPTDRPAQTRPTATRPTVPATDRPTHGQRAIDNAQELRRLYPNGVTIGTVRGDLKWSFERARNAVAAYNDGADLPTESTDLIDVDSK